MTDLEVTVDIDAPAERTWSVVTDWMRQGEWMPMTSVTVPAGTTNGVGATLSARSGLGPAAFVDPMVIDVWEPPHRCEVVHRGKVVTGRGVFIVEALSANRSRFIWREELDSVGVRKVIDRIGLPVSRVLLHVAMRRLAKLVATGAE